ncbi:MAG: tetratricopeptide repeat protein [Actinobacteria bacterium]|nr:tetratricopeptide repeat protein [Actinomycetota bacterium]
MARWTLPESSRARLPRPRTALVGRDGEAARVVAALGGARLVTLTGTGGVGKTRLAAAVAGSDASAGLAPDGVAWIDLAVVSDAGLVADTVRAGLGVAEVAELAVAEAIIAAVGAQRVLLCLDNCEHVVEAAAGLVDDLLEACPGLRVLATSREPLAVDGESLWPVEPLEVPSGGARTALQVRACAAGQLFELRARAASPSFELTDADAAAAAQLCRMTGGLPLTVELSAARVRLLSVAQIAAGMDDVGFVRADRVRGAPERQQSLRATLDWSYDLLTEPERMVFRRLGVFPGSFDLDAARAVTGWHTESDGEVRDADVTDLLGRLVDRSLLVAQRSGADMRYRLLAPIRSYARAQLAAAGEQAATASAHLAFYACVAGAAEPLLTGPGQVAQLDRLETEGNNLRVALEFAAGHRPAAVDGMRLATSLWRMCALRGYYREGRRWLDWAATVDAEAPTALRAKALLGCGKLAHLQCDYPAAVRRLEAALQRYRDLDDADGVPATLQALGCVARERGRYARAEALHRECLELASSHGDDLRVARSHGYLGFVGWLRGHWETAAEECRQALAQSRRIEDNEGVVWSLLSLGVIARYQGDTQTSGDLLGQARDLSTQMAYREGLAWTAQQLGVLALRRGDDGAEALLADALTGHRALGDRWRMASVLEDLADCAADRGDDRQAVTLLAAAANVRADIGTDIAPCERQDHDRVEAALRLRLTPQDFARAWARGQSTPLDDVLASPSSAVTPSTGSARAGSAEDHAPASDQLRIQALGGATVWRGTRELAPADWGYGKPRELLFLLASSPPRSKAEVGRALWPDLSDIGLRNAFHTALRDLRRALGDPGWVRFAAGRYTLDRARDHVSDLEIFTEALDAARQARPADAALPHLLRAVHAYGGEFAAGLPDAEWLSDRRAQLARQYARALAAAGQLLIAAGRIGPAVEIYRRAAAHDPLDETVHRNLINALIRAGQNAQAAQTYHQLADRLRDELGIAPSPEITAVYRRLHPSG